MPPRKRSNSEDAQLIPIRDADRPGRFLGAAASLDLVDVLLPHPGIQFDVIRPADLVALSVRAVDCELVKAGRTAYLLGGKAALLIVTYPFQHALEEAQYEEAAPVPTKNGTQDGANLPAEPTIPVEQPTWPVRFIPARGSRLVFRVPEGERIEFSSQGVLDAMTRLEMVVHRLATPGTPGVRGTTRGPRLWLDEGPPYIHLGNGLVLELIGEDLQIRAPGRQFFKDNPAPDVSTAMGAALATRELQRARALMAVRTPTIADRTKIPVGSEFEPGGPWLGPILDRPRPRTSKSSEPTATETAIEAPFRLIISPSSQARWAHAVRPVRNPEARGHVELWHSRLAGQPVGDDPTTERDESKPPRPNEKDANARSLRAIWTRDRDTVPNWEEPDTGGIPVAGLDHSDEPFNFIASLDRADRNMLVRQSSETWQGKTKPKPIPPTPFGADALWLSTLGAWLDLHGAWGTKAYSEQGLSSIMVWDHVAPMGRDQFVRVVYPGYLYPFGHQAALVKVTERKMKQAKDTVASLYQRMFIVIGERSRTYGLTSNEGRQFPFERVDLRPLNTPPIDRPDPIGKISSFFWPEVGKQRFGFVIDAWDREHRPVRMTTPLLWVSEAYQGFSAVDNEYAGSPHRRLAAHGQRISFIPRGTDPDTDLETESVLLLGRAVQGDSVPRMSAATVSIPAVQKLNPQPGPMPIRYYDKYVAEGLVEGQKGAVWADTLGPTTPQQGSGTSLDPRLPQIPQMRFGQGGAASDKSGGFMAPSLSLAALTRDSGPVGDAATIAAGGFDAKKFLEAAGGKLFGIVNLWDLIPSGLLDQAPAFVTETLGRIEAFLAMLERLEAAIEEARLQAELLARRADAAQAALVQKAADAQAAATKLATDAAGIVPAAKALLKIDGSPLEGRTRDQAKDDLEDLFDQLSLVIADLRAVGDLLPPQGKQLMHSLADSLDQVSVVEDVVDEILTLVNGLDPANLEVTMRYEWSPNLQDWPDDANALVHFEPADPTKPEDKHNLVLRVEGRVTASGQAEIQAIAEIRDLELRLFGAKPLMVMPIDHMCFKAGSSGKPEIDVVLGELEFRNELSFIETIKDLIPFDGFSDPPYVDVDTSGARAGFTLALPNLAVGVFNLSNISLGADVSIPFLGKTVTAGFDFCTREKPFSLTVMCLGGGGWFGVRVSPEGLEILELGLEAQASLAVDFGVASGSISASIGIYLRLEGKKGSLTGYFRLRGEVDVLGLISASIELYMSLTYHTDSGKMIGKATITVEVDVLCFSGSVEISAERKLAGSNGDPSFRQILGAEATGTSPYWNTYCDAFAGE